MANGNTQNPFGSDVRKQAAATRLALWLFLAALGMFFLATMLGYVIIRLWAPENFNISGTRAGLSEGGLSWGLLVSTVALIISSFTLHRGIQAVKIERQRMFRSMILTTAALAGVFLVVQAFSLVELLQIHYQLSADLGAPSLYALIVFMIAVHALHVVGGLVPLGVVTVKALRGGYDHEFHVGVEHFAMYWHFLDVVWMTMFLVFLIVG